jgi:hypothetical protein
MLLGLVKIAKAINDYELEPRCWDYYKRLSVCE